MSSYTYKVQELNHIYYEATFTIEAKTKEEADKKAIKNFQNKDFISELTDWEQLVETASPTNNLDLLDEDGEIIISKQ